MHTPLEIHHVLLQCAGIYAKECRNRPFHKHSGQIQPKFKILVSIKLQVCKYPHLYPYILKHFSCHCRTCSGPLCSNLIRGHLVSGGEQKPFFRDEYLIKVFLINKRSCWHLEKKRSSSFVKQPTPIAVWHSSLF